MAASIEKAFRQFVRTKFKARVQRQDGEYQTTVKGKTGKVFVTNPTQVYGVLTELCGNPVNETKNGHTFKFGGKKGEPTAMVTLAHIGDHDVLTMINQ